MHSIVTQTCIKLVTQKIFFSCLIQVMTLWIMFLCSVFMLWFASISFMLLVLQLKEHRLEKKIHLGVLVFTCWTCLGHSSGPRPGPCSLLSTWMKTRPLFTNWKGSVFECSQLMLYVGSGAGLCYSSGRAFGAQTIGSGAVTVDSTTRQSGNVSVEAQFLLEYFNKTIPINMCLNTSEPLY